MIESSSNIVPKNEIAHDEQFILLQHCFKFSQLQKRQKASVCGKVLIELLFAIVVSYESQRQPSQNSCKNYVNAFFIWPKFKRGVLGEKFVMKHWTSISKPSFIIPFNPKLNHPISKKMCLNESVMD